MPVTDAQLEMLFRYFDNELSSEEEARLMQQLQQDKNLLQAFDQQVLMQRFPTEEWQEAQAYPPELEPAGDFLNRVTAAMETPKATTPVVVLPKRKYRWQAAAAAVLVCLLAVWLYFILQPKKDKSGPLVKNPAKDSVAQVYSIPAPQKDSTATVQIPVRDTAVSLRRLYTDNYSTLQVNSSEVPVDAKQFQQLYEAHQYPQLAALTDAEIDKGRGDADEEQAVLDYFRLYSGLASLEAGQLQKAEKELLQVEQTPSGQPHIADNARWYLLLLYLKNNDRNKAASIADKIVGSKASPYYKKTVSIKNALAKR